MDIIYNSKKKTGIICHGQEALICPEKGIFIIPLALARGIEVYEFNCTYHGLEALQWAKFWLYRRDHKARVIGSYVPTPALKQESVITARQCEKELSRDIAKKNSLRKGTKMIATQGTWFTGKEQPLVGLGAYRP